MRIEYIELRKDPRINTEVEVTYYTEMPAARDSAEALRQTGTLTNVGDRGAGLLIDQPFRPDDRLRLEGVNGSREPRNCTVQWVQKERERYRIGVKFNDGGE